MTDKKFYDWQTADGTDDVMRLVDCLERADIRWCVIGGVAVNHWAEEPVVTQDVAFAVTADDVERAVAALPVRAFPQSGTSGRSTSREARSSASSSAPGTSTSPFRNGPLPRMSTESFCASLRSKTR